MKRIIFSLLLFAFFIQSSAQDTTKTTFEWKLKIKEPHSHENMYIPIQYSKGEYRYARLGESSRNGSSEEYFSFNTKDHKLSDYKKPQFNIPNTIPVGMVYLNKQFTYINLRKDDDSEDIEIWSTGKDTNKLITKSNMEWFKNLSIFYKNFSPDSTKILFANEGIRYSDQPGLSYLVCDSSFNELKKGSISNNLEISHNHDLYWDFNKHFDYTIDNEGNIYVLKKRYHAVDKLEKAKNKEAEGYYYLDLRKINASSNESVDLKFPDPMPKVDQYEMYINEFNELFIVATDSADLTYQIRYFKLDIVSNTFTESKVNDLAQQDFEKHVTTKTLPKKPFSIGHKLPRLQIRSFESKPDGGSILIMEYVTTYPGNRMNAGIGINDHVATAIPAANSRHDIFILGLDESGAVEWTTQIPKQQYASQEYQLLLSFYYFFEGSNMHFIYNEAVPNTKKKQNRHKLLTPNIPTNIHHCQVNIYNGHLEREILYTREQDQPFIIPTSGMQTSKNKVILMGSAQNKLLFGELTLNKGIE